VRLVPTPACQMPWGCTPMGSSLGGGSTEVVGSTKQPQHPEIRDTARVRLTLVQHVQHGLVVALVDGAAGKGQQAAVLPPQQHPPHLALPLQEEEGPAGAQLGCLVQARQQLLPGHAPGRPPARQPLASHRRRGQQPQHVLQPQRLAGMQHREEPGAEQAAAAPRRLGVPKVPFPDGRRARQHRPGTQGHAGRVRVAATPPAAAIPTGARSPVLSWHVAPTVRPSDGKTQPRARSGRWPLRQGSAGGRRGR